MDKFIKRINRLIAQIAKGNIGALDELYDLTGRMLFYMAMKYLFDKSYAEDLVSDTYLKVVRGAKGFDKRQNGLNWMYTILRNAAYDYNSLRVSSEVAADMQYHERKSHDEDIDEWLDRVLVKDAVDKLSTDEKRIIYLRYWEGLRLNEIAEQLNKSTAMAHVLVQKTLNKLKEYIE